MITHTNARMLHYNRKKFNAILGVSSMICTPKQIFTWSNQVSDGTWCMWHIWEI